MHILFDYKGDDASIQLQDYVKQLIDVMKQAEDLEDIKELHACCSCMQTIRKPAANEVIT